MVVKKYHFKMTDDQKIQEIWTLSSNVRLKQGNEGQLIVSTASKHFADFELHMSTISRHVRNDQIFPLIPFEETVSITIR